MNQKREVASSLRQALDAKVPAWEEAIPESDSDLIRAALTLWANHIETGNVVLSAEDAQQSNQPFKALDTQQMKRVIRLRELAEKHEV